MEAKKIALFFLAALASICIQAQDVREVTVQKPGKLMKLVKKELTTITKLRVTGNVNCEDIAVLPQMPNLEYLDIKDINFVTEDKHNDYDCKRGKFSFHGNLKKVREVYFPSSGYYSMQYLQIPKYATIHIPFDFSLYSNDAVDSVFVYTATESTRSEIKRERNATGKRIYGDDYIESNVKQMLTIHANKAVIFEKQSDLDAVEYERLETPVVCCTENGTMHVNHWDKNITREQSRKITSMSEGAFKDNKNITEFEFPECITNIPRSAFEGCHNLKTVIFPSKLESIGFSAFESTGLEEISFPESLKEIEHHAFRNTDVSEIEFPASLTKVAYDAFKVDAIETITMKAITPPSWFNFKLKKSSEIIIPEGSYAAYRKKQVNQWDWQHSTLIDNKHYGSFTINVPKGGTILSHISQDNLISADSLTISGILTEVDFKFIKKNGRLQYLDISNCYTTYSEEAINEYLKTRQMYSALFKSISKGLDSEYQKGNLGTLEYEVNKTIADEIAKANSLGKSNHEMCVIPENAFWGMESLEHVKLPILATIIGPSAFSGCSNLETVEMPPYLTRFCTYAFANCYELKNFTIPATVDCIQKGAFYNCNSIKKFKFPEIRGAFEFHDNVNDASCSLEELEFPEGVVEAPAIGKKCYNLRKVIYPSTVKKICFEDRDWDNNKAVPCEIHFKSQTPPATYDDGNKFGDDATIYCPKGTITAYMSRFGEKYKYIEE